MPSIKDSREAAQRKIDAGELVPTTAPALPPGVPSPTNSYPVNPNPLLRGPLPVQQWQSPDQQRQYQNPAVPQTRISPLPPTASAQVGASGQSQALAIVTAAAPVTTNAFHINKQHLTAYTVQVPDLNALITNDNNAGGIITLPPVAFVAGGAFVQSTGSTSATNTTSVGMTHLAGDTVMVVVKSGSGIGTLPTISDTQSHTWTFIDGTFDSGGIPTRMWYATNMSAGANTITATLVGASFMIMNAEEYSGMPLTASLDQHTSNVTNSSATVTSPNITLGTTPALVIGAFINGGGPGVTFTAGSGFTSRFTATDEMTEDRTVTGLGTIVSASVSAVPNVSTTVAIIASFATAGNAFGAPLPKNFFCWIENTGAGIFTVTSGAQIDNSASPVILGPNQGALFGFDGFNWFTERGIGTSLTIPITVPNGGTGDTTLTAHGVLIGEGTSPIAATSPGTAGQVLTSNGASADPTFQAPGLPAVMKINGTGVAADKQVYINGVTDGAVVWGININSVTDGG